MTAMPFFQRGRPRVFAHRGGSALAPENTLAAFEHGLRVGADGLELDVHLSADGVPVVVHDSTLDRTTNATGPVAARTAAELARVATFPSAVKGSAFRRCATCCFATAACRSSSR
jgi:glycerophosphoryl diester phosphodiesterase